MNKENIGKAKWNFVLNKLPIIAAEAVDESGRKKPLKRAKSSQDSDLDQITILFDTDALFENENQFFNEQTNQSLCKSISEDFYQRRTNSSYSLPIYLTGLYENNEKIPVSKTLIIAELNVLKKLRNNSNLNNFETGFMANFKDKSQTLYTNIETLLIGPTTINYLHKCIPSQYCKGDYLMINIGSYRECCLKLLDLNLSSEQIGSFALNFISNGIPVNINTLQQIETPNQRNFTQIDVDFLNRLIYHFCIKEVAKHMMSLNSDNKLPLATAHAMSIVLLRHGILDFTEVINNDARYGVYTGKQILEPINLEKTHEKVKRIFRKYQKYQAESTAISDSTAPIATVIDPHLKLENEFLILKQVYGEEHTNEYQSVVSDSVLKKYGLQRI